MLDSCKMVEKPVSSIPYVSLAFFFKFKTHFLLHIVLLKCPRVQIAFLKFTSCDNQALVECIPIAAVSCSFEAEIIKIRQSSYKMSSNKHTEFSRVYDNLKCLYKIKSGNLQKAPLYIYNHPQTDCLFVSQIFSMANHIGRLKLGSKPICIGFLCLHFVPSDIGVFNSLEELCITWVTAFKSLTRVLNIQGEEHIYCHP